MAISGTLFIAHALCVALGMTVFGLNTDILREPAVKEYATLFGNGEYQDPESLSGTSEIFKCSVSYRLSVYTQCGDDFCRCQNQAADCSFNRGNLKYIPQFHTKILWLTFIFNNLTSIHDTFFQNVTQVEYLDLSDNGLRHISTEAFTLVPHLQVLRLTGNNLTYVMMKPVLSIATLEKLDLSVNGLGPIPAEFFQNSSLQELSVLCFSFNNLRNLNMSVLKPLVRLHQLNVEQNQLATSTIQVAYLPSLAALSLGSNSISTYIDACHNGTSLLPNVTSLSFLLDQGWDELQPSSLCLPRLQMLNMRELVFSKSLIIIMRDTFNKRLFPELSKLAFSSSRDQHKFQIDKHAFRNPTLSWLDLGFASIDFSQDAVDSDCFAGCTNLQVLKLHSNDFSKVTEEKFNRLFSQIPALSSLRLVSVGLRRITHAMFANLSNLTELYLQSNKLTEVPDGVFQALEHLRRLDLSANYIRTVTEGTFSADTRRRLRFLSLSNNSFQCSCELRWFQHWLTTDPALFNDSVFRHHQWNTYQCDNLPNTTLQSFQKADQACLLNPGVSKFIIATIVILMLPVALGTALHRYRWHIRLALYEAFRGRGDRWRRLQEQHFRYDAFVCYDSRDLDWVRQHLLPELENRLGLRLCIHQRDFMLGTPIVENIEDSINNSKKVLMVFSKNFAESEWCQFELQLGLSHVLTNDDELLVALIDDIPSRDLTPAMMAVMKTMTYIEWQEEPEARASFWGRMRLALTAGNDVVPDV